MNVQEMIDRRDGVEWEKTPPYDETMDNLKMHEGKSKALYATGDPNVLLMKFKDDITAGDGAKKEQMSNKGVLNCTISKKIYESLKDANVNTHYISSPSSQEQFVKALKIIPVEVVLRNVSAGSICRRYGINKGIEFKTPLLELFLKDDDLHDPLVNEDVICELGWADRSQLREMKEQGHIIHKHMTDYWAEHDLTLVDAKYEFGVDNDGNIMLADEITCDSQRIWTKDGKSLDKDVFRQGDNMQDVEDVYNYIHRLIGADAI